MFLEYASGATQARAKGMECLDYLQPGNVLMVADLARLGRSTAYLADIVTVLGQPGTVHEMGEGGFAIMKVFLLFGIPGECTPRLLQTAPPKT